MMRASPTASMQKTYDQCYIICSTAVYFEKQNNEEEALRSWREALDQIYYNNAFRIPASYVPKTETEKALRDSLREMEVQCKERVDLLETLRKSREDSGSIDGKGHSGRARNNSRSKSHNTTASKSSGNLASGIIPTFNYPDLARPTLPQRRSASGGNVPKAHDKSRAVASPDLPPRPYPSPVPPNLEVPTKSSRTPSPDKKTGMFKSTLRPGPRDRNSTGKLQVTMRNRPPAAAGKAATLAWPNEQATHHAPPDADPMRAEPTEKPKPSSSSSHVRPPSPSQFVPRNPHSPSHLNRAPPPPPHKDLHKPMRRKAEPANVESRRQNHVEDLAPASPPTLNPLDKASAPDGPPAIPSPPVKMPEFPTYRREYTSSAPVIDPKKAQEIAALAHGNRGDAGTPNAKHRAQKSPERKKSPTRKKPVAPISRKAVPTASSPRSQQPKPPLTPSDSSDSANTLPSDGGPEAEESAENAWAAQVKDLIKHLPKGVDETAAKAILNEIVIKGDEVHWDDVAGLDIAKSALKEAVVYPFLRPDLFMGLREPARGMLLFGPPGTGKTMLARAVATESRSTFFSISASSLTSKFLGESEKLVRALFALAKRLAPSIIFVDEIDSLLSSRGNSSEHEATRRIKTEFLIQWSDLQKAAAGREDKNTEGDASRVLVLAATNTPWAIDEAARRRFVRRQYIPLPEGNVRRDQLKRLMVRQKIRLKESDYEVLVQLTDGFSGSDITALAKDAAMGPLRSLGEQLLHMSPEDIRPIGMEDFESSLVQIRPSVGKQGLKEYDEWAKEFGERGG